MIRPPQLPGWAASATFLAAVVACTSPTSESPITISAAVSTTSSSPSVEATDPTSAEQGTTLDVRVLGSGFEPASKVALLIDGKASTKVRTNSTSYLSSGELVANVTIDSDADITAYDVQVTNTRGKKGIGIDMFEVLEKSNPGQWESPPLLVTFRDGSGGTDAIRADDADNTSYPEPGKFAVNGNLMFWLNEGHPRTVRVRTTAYDDGTRDRVYTNNHTNPGGDDSWGFLGMVNGSTGTAVLEIEVDLDGHSTREGIVRYGKDCTGDFGTVIESAKAVTTRSADGLTFTIEATEGVHCKQVKERGKSVWRAIGTAGPVRITLQM